MDKFMTIREVAAHLRMSHQSVRRLILDGRLAAHKIGRCSYRVREDAIRVMLMQTLAKTSVNTSESALERKEDAK
jgi:excisionase family DNA binding protein